MVISKYAAKKKRCHAVTAAITPLMQMGARSGFMASALNVSGPVNEASKTITITSPGDGGKPLYSNCTNGRRQSRVYFGLGRLSAEYRQFHRAYHGRKNPGLLKFISVSLHTRHSDWLPLAVYTLRTRSGHFLARKYLIF